MGPGLTPHPTPRTKGGIRGDTLVPMSGTQLFPASTHQACRMAHSLTPASLHPVPNISISCANSR